ncbi:MAG: hypothetical protein K0Q95_2145 [Bacteroidota bacterium]|jgi:hypothetical protein|nr:hypothetical protein [Bacteroidota bacterium]
MSRSILNKEEIRGKYEELLKDDSTNHQRRGFEFENMIYSILYNESLEPRASYKPVGEQVDGSFFWQGQTFLLEAKWVKDPVPASSIYAFKGKVDGKFHTSSGVFISVNGYSDDAEDALLKGKTLNILLFDENDITIIFNGEVTFLEVLKFKLREAGDTGSLRVPYTLKERAEKISKTNSELISVERFYSDINEIIPKKDLLIGDLLVFVEGKTDIPIIKKLLEPIKKHYSLSYKVDVLNGANNIRQLPSLLSVYSDYKKAKAVIVFLDDDQAARQLENVIVNIGEQLQKSSIPVRPIFLHINESLKHKLSKRKLSIETLRSELIFEKLETFIQQIAQDYYDPEVYIPLETLKNSLETLDWNFKQGVIYGREDESGHSTSIDSLEELIKYLDEEIIHAMNGEMPMHWLKEQDYLDYDHEVREYLRDNHLGYIKKMGWDINNL